MGQSAAWRRRTVHGRRTARGTLSKARRAALARKLEAIKAFLAATPDPNADWITVGEWDVIEAGLIKKMIYVNPDLPRRVELATSETAHLLERAEAKRKELKAAYAARGARVNPLVLVQLPNGPDAPLAEVVDWYAARQVTVEGGELAVWLADRKDNTDGLAANDGRQVAVVLKQAVATGWDCPRAQILVKLRRNMDETFEIQTIGRIRRMPEARHYGDDALDGCYLYTFDEKFTERLRAGFGRRALDARNVFLKDEHRAFALMKEQRTMVSETQDPRLALTALRGLLDEAYGLTEDVRGNLRRLARAGWEVGEAVLVRAVTGNGAVMEELARREALQSGLFVQRVSTHLHERSFHHAVAEVGAACALGYADMLAVLRKLFSDDSSDTSRRLALGTRALYAFVLNNCERLCADGRSAMARQDASATVAGAVSERLFHFPRAWLMTFDGAARSQAVAARNVYRDAVRSAAPRSSGEVAFEKWCEESPGVAWWYRNGDKGEAYFSLVYADNAGKERLFYPDYILSAGGDMWIVEVKGGFRPGGASENVDPFAAKKAVALAAYCRKRGVRGGFVCEEKATRALLVYEGGYSEDASDAGWRAIGDVVG